MVKTLTANLLGFRWKILKQRKLFLSLPAEPLQGKYTDSMKDKIIGRQQAKFPMFFKLLYLRGIYSFRVAVLWFQTFNRLVSKRG